MMKQFILITCSIFSIAAFSHAQTADSVMVKKERKAHLEIGKEGVNIHIGKSDSTQKDKKGSFPKISFGFNFEHFDIGLSKYHNNGDFGFPNSYDFLEHNNWKTHTFGFDILQFGVRFNPNFKIALAGGIDWNHIRLEKDVTIRPDSPVLTADPSSETNLKKNRFSSRYVRVPLYFEYRSNQGKDGKRFSVVAGPEVGFLIDGKVKQKTDGGEKIKVKDDFNFNQFRYGANVRLGYGGAGLFFKYYLNDVFAETEAPGLEGYKNLSFGLTFGF
ncbi:outer membrane beta-barrel protein [Pedobacter glucosidilyticus]|uniref:outer membrane beta-barrel protein n=1 Tax=Pedobacter glucosidilyticus TaxID=1122941 RepID=UPI0026F11E2C|nr:outer membrane beta-barrel protein [Pedobacter glucosidilyticus]